MSIIRLLVLVMLFMKLPGECNSPAPTSPKTQVSRLNPATRLRGIPRAMEEIFRPKRVEYPRGT